MSPRTDDVETLCPGDGLEDWDSFVDRSPQGCIFCRSWWLEAIAEDRFRLLALRGTGAIVAGMPLVWSSPPLRSELRMPPITQTLGVLLSGPTEAKYATALSNEMKAVRTLAAAIPPSRRFSMNFHYTFTNWLPFYWAGYTQTTRYTYVIENVSDLERVFGDMTAETRNTIRKAEKADIRVEQTEALDEFLDVNSKTFARQGMKLPYSRELVRRVDKACAIRNARTILLAKDENGRVHSGAYLVHDTKCMYNLLQGSDPDLRQSGANSLTMWRAIQLANKLNVRFDFEGSMIAPVEQFNRSFGARQMRYFAISKDSWTWLDKARSLARSVGRRLLFRVGGGRRHGPA